MLKRLVLANQGQAGRNQFYYHTTGEVKERAHESPPVKEPMQMDMKWMLPRERSDGTWYLQAAVRIKGLNLLGAPVRLQG